MEGVQTIEYIWGPLDGTTAEVSKLADQIWAQSPHEEHVRRGIFPVYSLTDIDSRPIKYKFLGWSNGEGCEPRTGK